MKKDIKNKKGFSLLEALVSIAILSLAIAGAFAIAPEGISATRFARNQITASYLAQEALEIVRNKRDSAMFAGQFWLTGLDQCLDQKCQVDAESSSLSFCVDDCRLKIRERNNASFYGHGLGENSVFYRSVEMSLIDPEEKELRVKVTVSWFDLGEDREIVVYENLFKWWPGP